MIISILLLNDTVVWYGVISVHNGVTNIIVYNKNISQYYFL